MNYLKDKTSKIDDAQIGDGTRIWAWSHLTSTAVVGKNCNIGEHCYIAGQIGDNCKIANGVNVYEGVFIEDLVFIGNNTSFSNVRKPKADKKISASDYMATIIGRNTSIGANCTILAGVNVGKNCVIGDGTVVIKDIPDGMTVVGNPCRIIKNKIKI